MRFQWNPQRKIILYGAASIGMIFYAALSQSGVQILGFIDQRADELHECMGLPVWDIGGVPAEAKEGCVVVVSVKNVFEHSHIARQLVQNGFHQLIYRPLAVIRGNGSENERELNEAYDRMEQGSLPADGSLPQTMGVPGHIFRDCALIREEGGDVVVRLPLRLLRTNQGRDAQWSDLPIHQLTPHLSLYAYAAGEPVSPQPYLDFCLQAAAAQGIQTTDAWKRNVLRNRCMIYDEMSNHLEWDPQFFARNPPRVDWNKNGHFNLRSGKHRATFFAFRRMRFMPVRMSREDYEIWLNRPLLDRILPLMEGLEGWPEWIPHPYFYDFPVTRGGSREKAVAPLLDQLRGCDS